jgi:hypothetical protein
VLPTFFSFLAASAEHFVSLQRNSTRAPFLLDILARDRLVIIDRKAANPALSAFLLHKSFPQSLTIDFNGRQITGDQSTSPIDLRRLVIGTIANVCLENFSGQVFWFYPNARVSLSNLSIRRCSFWMVPKRFADGALDSEHYDQRDDTFLLFALLVRPIDRRDSADFCRKRFPE